MKTTKEVWAVVFQEEHRDPTVTSVHRTKEAAYLAHRVLIKRYGYEDWSRPENGYYYDEDTYCTFWVQRTKLRD